MLATSDLIHVTYEPSVLVFDKDGSGGVSVYTVLEDNRKLCAGLKLESAMTWNDLKGIKDFAVASIGDSVYITGGRDRDGYLLSTTLMLVRGILFSSCLKLREADRKLF